ncbi:MAG TPA: BTAD domain-containing putative transcriptional regulator, partial [Gemmatimonadales bacterium]|nr:BTAD domain-containing putative transcriptional regulator [Gemmatimonadales bacterium]
LWPGLRAVMIRFRVLGLPDLRGEDATELRAVLTQPRLMALFSYLAVARPGGFHRRDSLVALFWPELNSEGARNALRQTVHRLRAAVGEGVVVNRGTDELGVEPTRLWCDAAAFETTLEAGDPLGALELYRGDLLPGFFLSDAPEFERWLESERARLRQRALSAAWSLADRAAAGGNAATTAHWARWAAALTPEDEGALRHHLELLLRVGDKTGAQRAYDAFARRLAEDYQAEPAPETRALLAGPIRPSPPKVAASPAAVLASAGIETPEILPKPNAPEPLGVPARPGYRWLVPALAAVVITLVLGVGWMRARVRPDGASEQALAVFPFSVRGSPTLEYLREGLVDLLSAKLEGASGVRSIDPRATIAAARGTDRLEPRRAAAAALDLGARWLVLGDVVEIAGRVTVSAALYSARDPTRPTLTRSVEGDASRLAELVDDLAGQVLAGQVRTRDTTLTRIASLTTHSLPALKAYLAGEQALRAGRDAEADALFQEAVDLDSTFALARYRLAIVTVWVPRGDALLLADQAARHADRLTPLARDLLLAYQAYRQGAADRAERLYRQVTSTHPDNVEAWIMLGETWFHFNPYRGRFQEDSEAAFRRALALDSINPHALIHLARSAAFGGRRATLDSVVRQFLALYPTAERGLELRALRAFAARDSLESARVMAQALTQSDVDLNTVWEAAALWTQNWDWVPRLAAGNTSGRDQMWLDHWGRWVTAFPLARGKFREAAMAGTSFPVNRGWLLESRALMAADRFFNLPRAEVAAVRDEVERSRPYPVQPYMLGAPDAAAGAAFRSYLLGLLSARLADTVTARHHLSQVAIPGDTMRQRVGRDLSTGLAAEITRARGNTAEAFGMLEHQALAQLGANRLLAHWGTRERFLRAELLVGLGRDQEALPWYASFRSYYDLLYMAPAHFRQGQIYQRLGNVERALFHYGRFVDLWKDSDPELRPLVAQAREAAIQLSATAPR